MGVVVGMEVINSSIIQVCIKLIQEALMTFSRAHPLKQRTASLTIVSGLATLSLIKTVSEGKDLGLIILEVVASQ